MIELTINKKIYEGKFNFKAMFKANQLYSSQGSSDDGASQLWIAFVTGDDSAVYKALRVLLPNAKVTDDEIMDFLDEKDAAGEYDQFAKELESELQHSGFFRRAAQHWLDFTDRYKDAATAKMETGQKKAMNSMLEEMRKSLS